MKHPVSTTAILIMLFIAAQVVGLSLLALNISGVSDVDGKTVVEHAPTVLGDRPSTTGGESVLMLSIGIAIGTILLLILIKFRAFRLWKLWFLLAVWFSTSIAFGVLIPGTVALIVCLGLAAWKVFRPNPVIHNLTEVFMYAGIAILIVPILSIGWAVVMLAIISVYDIIAVWHSKHMVTMAQAQQQEQLFAGLLVPKANHAPTAKSTARTVGTAPLPPPSRRTAKTRSSASSARTAAKRVDDVAARAPAPTAGSSSSQSSGSAILGGGDIAFPLIFAGVTLDWLVASGVPKTFALYQSLFVVAGATVALAVLFALAKKDKFYPAMPPLSIGCLIGFAIVWLL